MLPIPNLLTVQFKNSFEFAPQQGKSRIASLMREHLISGAFKPSSSIPRSDGVYYDPSDSDYEFRPDPFQKFKAEKHLYRRWGFTWAYIIARDDLYTIEPEFTEMLPRIARYGYETFKDRIVLNALGRLDRLGVDFKGNYTANLGAPAYSQMYAVTEANSATLQNLDLKAVQDLNDKIGEVEGYSPEVGKRSPFLFVGSNAQINQLSYDTNVSEANIDSLNALGRGDSDTFYNFKFIRTNALPKLSNMFGANFYADKTGKRTVSDMASASVTQLAATPDQVDQTIEPFFVFHPYLSGRVGRNPANRFSKVYHNFYNRAGDLEFLFRDVYQASIVNVGSIWLGLAKKKITDDGLRKAPVKGNEPYDNKDGGSVWSYSNVA